MNREALLALLHAGWLGRRIECFAELPSSNDRARSLLDELGPEAHGAVVFADRQSSGRGRLGRTWVSPPGLGLAMSVALRPANYPANISCLPLAGSLAAAALLTKAAGLSPSMKWPNDVLVDGRKIAGVLLEGRYLSDRPSGLVMGIGINLYQSPSDFPPELRERATSVVASGGPELSREIYAAALLRELEPLIDEGLARPEGLVEKAEALWDHRRGDLLEVAWTGGSLTGRFLGVDPDGSLALDCDDARRTVRFGDVVRVRRGGI
jgi:BirA family biotin operon repressor/biotin-[acetyl-CoA-carboxylase] ligase